MSAVSLYAPYRAIGYVTDGNPFVVSQLGTENFVTLSIGESFQVLRADRLTTCLVSEQVPTSSSGSSIACLQAVGHETYVGVGSDILVYHRTRTVRTYANLSQDSPVKGMIVVGKVLFAYYDNNFIQILDTKARTVVGSIELLEESAITALIHPATYLNKILVGFESGAMELWNFRRKSLVHVFTCHIAYFDAQRQQSKEDIFGNELDNGVVQNEAIPAITCIEQSPACDVVAVGFASGDIILINLKFDAILFSFKQSGKGSADGSSCEKGAAVTSLTFRTDSAAEKFPYMVSGSEDGRIYVWYLGTGDKEDDEEEEVEKEPRKLMLTIDDAHSGKIGKVHFMYGEPVLISSSEDNSLKMWIFDSPDGSARLLRGREGHSQGGPHRIRFYGGTTNVSMRDNADGYSCEMLSAGADGAFRLFNFAVESQNREMSQKPMLKKLGLNRRNEKLPEMTSFDFCETRQRDWADIASIHRNHSNTYLWRLKNRVITETVLRQPNWKTNAMTHAADRSTHSSAVTLTSCGHFCVVGSKGGVIYIYNVQSGMPRGSYPVDAAAPLMTEGKTNTRLKLPGNVLHEKNKILGITDNEKTGQTWKAGSLSDSKEQKKGDDEVEDATLVTKENEVFGHTGEVTGLFVDTTMSVLVSSGLDGKVIFWDFNTHKILGFVDNASPILKMEGFRDGNFVAVVSQDRLVRVYDLTSHKLCRRFDGHSREVTDVAFTPDGRRLLTCSMDCTVRVWDMATARCLSWLKFDDAVVSMCLSLSGEYLCLTFADKDGIYMYIDRSLYETVHFWKEPSEPSRLNSCRVLSDNGPDVKNEENEDDNEENEVSLVVSVQAQVDSGMSKEATEQRGDGVITLSDIPKAYWTSLLNLEAIKQRNQAKAAPVAPPLAPFFLPTVVKSGESVPSFPTPAEYKKLVASTASTTAVAGDNTVLGKRSAGADDDGADDSVESFSHMASAWSDDEDGEDSFGAMVEEVEEEEGSALSLIPDTRHQSTSRIIRRRTELPRCKLVAYIEMLPPTSGTVYGESPIIGYLKSIGPPAVDAEMRALCRDAQDELGVKLLGKVLSWFAEDFKTCENFEVLQAYLHRFLFIYSEVLLECPILLHQLRQVKALHEASCQKFRHLVQSNLCVLKMMAQIPSL